MALQSDEGYALKNGEGPHIDFRGTKMTVKVGGQQTKAGYSLMGMLKKAASGVLAILPCSRTRCMLRASK